MQKLDTALRAASRRLIAADVATPSLDARLLLQHACGISQLDIMTDPDRPIADEMLQAFEKLLSRRLAGEPVSRILGEREFYGRVFKTSPDVLDPRPDTETLVSLCLDHLPANQPHTILDLGTGSGILAITLLAERTRSKALAIDVSAEALAIARSNAETLAVARRIAFAQSHWFERVEGTFDLIVSNPPYIESATIPNLEIEVRDHDPRLALDGGEDGLDAYRMIAQGVGDFLTLHGLVAVEVGAGQSHDVAAIFARYGHRFVAERTDLGGHIRALLFSH